MFKKILLVIILTIIQNQFIHSMEQKKPELVEIKWLLNLSKEPATFYHNVSSESGLLEKELEIKTVSPGKRKKGFILTVSPEIKEVVTAFVGTYPFIRSAGSYESIGQTKELILFVAPNLKLEKVTGLSEKELDKIASMEKN